MEAINFVVAQIGKAFGIMSQYEVMPGISLLTFSIILLLIHTLFDIFWFGQKSYMSDKDIAHRASVAEEARIKTRNAVYKKQMTERNRKK